MLKHFLTDPVPFVHEATHAFQLDAGTTELAGKVKKNLTFSNWALR